MTRYVLAGHFGPDDHFGPQAGRDEELKRFDLCGADGRLAFGIGHALTDMRRLNVRPSEIGIDLLVLAVHVHAADTRLSRRNCAQDAWTREIKLVVPVSDPALWQGASETLHVMLRFLTGDHWVVAFRDRPAAFRRLMSPEIPGLDDPHFDGVSLYSGGLDSLIGLIDEVVRGHWPYFVSHAGEGAVSKPQNELFDDLRTILTRRTGSNRQIERLRYAARFPAKLFTGVGSENTTRGRSFLFLSLGAAAGTGLNRAFDLRIPENGFIALNVPLDPTRLGASTTRTTHPFYLHRWNELLGLIGVPGNVVNPYWDRTKGEMIEECKAPDVLRSFLSRSVSCAHPSAGRFKKDNKSHCGTCVPCLIRRAAVTKAWGAGNDPTSYRCDDLSTNALDATKADGQQVRGYQHALARLRDRPDLAGILVYKPGPLREDLGNLEKLIGVYTRSMGEVGQLLEDVRTFSSKMPN